MVDLNPNDSTAVLGGRGDMNLRLRGDFGSYGLYLPGDDDSKILHSIWANGMKLLKPATIHDIFEHHLSL